MKFDSDNPVVKRCVQGMELEAKGKIDEAHKLFQEAWNIASNDFERFTSAHYLARNQKDPKDELQWNLEALKAARKIDDEEGKEHFSSLYLNIGRSYEKLEDQEKAWENYRLAHQFGSYLPPTPYGGMIKSGITEALKRTGSLEFKIEALDLLITDWCGRQELKALSFILPAYVPNLGTVEDINELISALSYLVATKSLNGEDQSKVEKLISKLSFELSHPGENING